MKRKIYLLSVLLVSISTLLFTSCKKDDNSTTTPVAPSITISGVSDPVTVDITNANDVVFNIEITADAGVKTFEAKKTVGSQSNTFNPTKISDVKYNYTYTKADQIADLTSNTQVVFTFTVTDKNGLTGTKTLTINKKAVTVDYNTYTAVLLYGPNDNNSSKTFFASTTGLSYTFTEASGNSGIIDFGFQYDVDGQTYTGLKACLISADKYSLNGHYTTTGWNTTVFKTSTDNFDNINSASGLKTSYDNGSLVPSIGSYPQGSIAKGLTTASVVSFKTAAGKYGLIKVTNVYAGALDAGTITITVKVQK
ncbi:MAG: hypothetical protein Q8880_03055 [Bacteroidota bacterium]|nr:hypothetical protein [Bacteroidota bacterium]